MNVIRKKSLNILKIVLALIICVGLTLPATGCSILMERDTNRLDVCLASEPQSLDPGLNTTVDGNTMIQHLFSGLSHWDLDENGDVTVQPEIAKELVDPVETPDGKFVYTYQLNDNFKWSDGYLVKAKDFVFAWNRSASVSLASDFSYMFEIVDGYEEIWADDPSPDAKLNITALDDYTLQVVTVAKVPYWNELLAFPVFMPLREDVVDDEGMWAASPETYVSNGPYTMSEWKHNSYIETVRSGFYPKYDSITMPQITYYLSDNTNNQLANFSTGEWEFIKDIPTNEIKRIKENYPEKYHCDSQVGIYYISWNDATDLSPTSGRKLSADEQAEVRGAISKLIDRNYICDEITQGDQKPASSFIPMGVKESTGEDFYLKSGKAGNPYYGYFSTAKEDVNSNYSESLETLKKYYTFDESGNITDFPQLTYIYNTNEAHKAIAEYIQSVFAGVGIKMSLQNQEWASFLITKKQGDFCLCRNSWIADYNDPICFLDLHLSTSGNNSSRLGKGPNADKSVYSLDLSDIEGYEDKSVANGTWAQTYDELISYIRLEDNLVVRDKLMHRAEDMLMKTNTQCPIYFYTHTYLLNDKVKGHFSNPLAEDFFMYTTFED